MKTEINEIVKECELCEEDIGQYHWAKPPEPGTPRGDLPGAAEAYDARIVLMGKVRNTLLAANGATLEEGQEILTPKEAYLMYRNYFQWKSERGEI